MGTDNQNSLANFPRRPKYRMIAIDLDGTLLSPNGKVSERNKLAVHKALSAGLLVCFATGRNWTESQAVLAAVSHYSTAVFVGGAMVIDTAKRVTLHRTLMQPALAREVCSFFENLGFGALALQDKGTAGVDYVLSEAHAIDEVTRQWWRIAQVAVNRTPSLAVYAHEHTIRVGIVATPENAAKAQAELTAKFGNRVVSHSLALMSFGLNVLEVFDPAVNKWEGILHVARHHHISPEEIIAIGDDMNDLPMITQAGLGVAMGNARPEVQAVAKRVIGSNKDDGLAIFLEELVAEHEVEPLDESET